MPFSGGYWPLSTKQLRMWRKLGVPAPGYCPPPTGMLAVWVNAGLEGGSQGCRFGSGSTGIALSNVFIRDRLMVVQWQYPFQVKGMRLAFFAEWLFQQPW